MVELRRARTDDNLPELREAVNRIIDALLGNTGGRIALIDDDGVLKSTVGGATLGTSEPSFKVRSAVGEHVLIQHSNGLTTLLEVQDSGVTINALTLTGNLTVQGVLQVDGNSLLGNSDTDTTTVRGVHRLTYNTTTGFVTLQATNSATPDLEIKRNDGTQLLRALNAGGLIVGTASAMSGSELIRVQGQARIEGLLTVSTGGADITGAIVGSTSIAAGTTLAAGTTVTGGTGVTATTGDVTATAGNLVGKHLKGNGTAPTAGTLTNWGAGATATVTGKDLACRVRIQAGTGPAADPSFTLTFNSAYGSTPIVIRQYATVNDAALEGCELRITAQSTTAISIQAFKGAGFTPTNGSSYDFYLIFVDY